MKCFSCRRSLTQVKGQTQNDKIKELITDIILCSVYIVLRGEYRHLQKHLQAQEL